MKLTIVLSCLLLVSCGGSDDGDEPSGGSPGVVPPGEMPRMPGGMPQPIRTGNPELDEAMKNAHKELPAVQGLMSRKLTSADLDAYIAITKAINPILSDVRDPSKAAAFRQKQEEICKANGLSGSLEWGMLRSRIDAALMHIKMKIDAPKEMTADVELVRSRLDEVKAANNAR